MNKIISICIWVLFTLFTITTGFYSIAHANEENHWLDTQDNVNKLGVEKIWFTYDLNKAVFLRSQRLKQLSHLDNFYDKTPTQLDSKMSHLNDTLYFYNMNPVEVQNWLSRNFNVRSSSIWFSVFIHKAYAESNDCAINASASNVGPQQTQSFLKNITNIVKGDFLKKMVGCSTQDPKIDERQNQSLSVKDFSNALKNHWEQLKEIIAQLPHMPLPEDVKHELICDGLSVGIFAAQGAALSLTGAGVFVAIPRLFLALKRLMNTSKYLKKIEKTSAKSAPAAQKVLTPAQVLTARLESVYGTQKKFIENLQAGQKQILDKGGKLTTSGKANSNYTELYDWAKAEVDVQKDFIKTLNSLEKAKNQGQQVRKISFETERAAAEQRIKTLNKAFKFETSSL